MHPSHPYIKQEANRAIHSEMNQLRNLLFRQGKEIEGRLLRAEKQFSEDPSDSNRIALAVQVGEAKGYAAMRKKLGPKVASDGLSNMLDAKAKKIERSLIEVT